MKHTVLSPTQLEAELLTLPGWQLRNEKLWKQFLFPDFIVAWGFISQVALVAESHAHHPKWSNSYNKVDIELSTHDASGVTQKDLDLAHAIERILKP